MARQHDIDWLRVILFGLLVPFHAAAGFTAAGERVYGVTNEVLAPWWLMMLIGISHQFRLHSLFLISGIGTWFAFRRRGLLAFWGERLLRLGVPLVFATLTLNLLMAYMQARAQRQGLGLAEFAAGWLREGGIERVQHLWFILVLLVFSLALGPVFAALRRFEPAWPGRLVAWGLGGPVRILVVPALPFLALILALKPGLGGDTGSGHTIWLYGLYFLAGFLIMGAGPGFRLNAGRVWPAALGLGLGAGLGYMVLLGAAGQAQPGLAQLVDRGGWAGEGAPSYGPLFLASMLLDAVSSWWLTLAAFGLAARFLDRPSPVLATLNQAVYPFYVLHMICVSTGVLWAARTGWPWGLELAAVVLGSYAACWLGYLALRATRLTRFLFGIKPAPGR